MKFRHGWGYSVTRWAMAMLWLFVAVVLLWLFSVFVGMWKETSLLTFGLLMISGIWWLHLVAIAIHEMSAITISEEGIWIRLFWKAQLTSWEDVRQAGVLWRSSRSGHYNDLVLLRKGGSLRKYRDKTFVLRNEFRLRYYLIHLPYTPEVMAFVRKQYGPLDFNLADGQGEQNSIVEDMDIFQE